ncbi:helix-turn-helix domain-containing protein [Streptantibioticus ferralitis]|uniref:Helix-turn-helix transcriptional regulator n=1 Tax=Streptantibioticus ferralitis TaxID=236510 RepID=A0ABT5ZB74_9ACTN|nr:helix-turn-helix transcriptional regulator [Streptantibioticus ferralitis]MDF2260928.1 helix-turn-helix transcriptional regulator [Streptantibioticus ferralitis]
MPDHTDSGIGARVRVARIAAGLTQTELAGLVGRSTRWLEDVEAGRLTLDRYSLIAAIAETCAVDVTYLLGLPYRLAADSGPTAHSYVPALRAVLRRSGLILSGHPGLVPAAPVAAVDRMRQQSQAANRARQGAALPQVASMLPGMIEDLNTAILLRGAETIPALHLLVDAARTARVTLNQLGYPDLAWVAAEVAAGAATRLDDPISKARVAWDRCGALLHQASLREVLAVADAALSDLAPAVATGAREAISLRGALILRCAVASARAGRPDDAWAHIDAARVDANRLGEDWHDLAQQTVFGVANVAVHAAEVGVEIDQPDRGLEYAPPQSVAVIPSRERITHYRIDQARSWHRMGRSAAAVAALRQAGAGAPYQVYGDPMARALVMDLTRTGVPSQAAALSGLVRNMELVG